MKTWLYFYIQFTIKNGKPFHKANGWTVGHKWVKQ